MKRNLLFVPFGLVLAAVAVLLFSVSSSPLSPLYPGYFNSPIYRTYYDLRVGLRGKRPHLRVDRLRRRDVLGRQLQRPVGRWHNH